MYDSIDDIRQEFVNFFQKKEHRVIPSSSLVPANDQTLLFTNAGMNQFKNIFLGLEQPLFKRVVTVQRCMRAGGKHNDLDNVGYTDRHLTFFEMLGNFSFGDYFKNDAIQFAWELLTNRNWFNLSKDKIWVTTHIRDNESYNVWVKDVGISNQHIIKIGNKETNFCDSDNFWRMGNIGPCGPCSEIFYDRGNDFEGTPLSDIQGRGERYIEIWNLVFMQFNHQIDGRLISLPMLSVDTGMGLERITSILQGVHSSYLIDVFKSLIISISQIMKIKKSITHRSLYVIADHIRASVFLIKDGIIPSNEGRGYVLRRIIRRAICHGKKLGVNNIFLYKLVASVIIHMKCLTDKLYDQKDLIEQILWNEEKLFENTLKKGLELLEKELVQLKRNTVLNGSVVFRLYTTYGFPLELTKDICYDRNIQIDQSEFDRIMLEEKKISKQSNQFCIISNNTLPFNIISRFVGYRYLSYTAKIVALLQDTKLVNMIHENTESVIVLDITPFYGESGGQIGDSGYLKTENAIFIVLNVKKYGQTIAHIGIVKKGIIKVGDQVFAEVDQFKRKQICLNHSATHLLHAALFKILGSHVAQQGSLINNKYLRFDFMNYKSMTDEQIHSVENLVNQQIWKNLSITTDIMSMKSACDINAFKLLHKQYGEKVRVLRIGNFSTELCGGTHAICTGEIGLFIIIKESGIGSGIRRIEAVTENKALSWIQNKKTLLQNIIHSMHSDDENILNKIHEFKSSCHKLEKTLKRLQNKQEFQKSLSLIKDLCYIENIPVLVKQIKNLELQTLFNIIGYLKYNLKSGVIVLLNLKSNKVCHIMISITKDLVKLNRINALELMHDVMHTFGGKGGGKPDFAQVSISNVITESIIVEKIHRLLNKSINNKI